MNELLLLETKIKDDGTTSYYITARKLCEKLGFASSQINRWIKRNIEQNENFIKDKDWRYIENNLDRRSKNRKIKDIELSLPFAKYLCLKTDNQYSFEIYKYFEDCEQKLLNRPRIEIPNNLASLPLEDLLIRTGMEIKKMKKEVDEAGQKIINMSLIAKGKAKRDEISAKINANIRQVAMSTNTPYQNVWSRLYRMFEANFSRVWFGKAMQSKNHWEYIKKNAPIDDLQKLFEYSLIFLAEVADKTFFAENADSLGNLRIENKKGDKNEI